LVIAGQVEPKDIRFFVGYSGWGPEQLKEELDSESWIVAKPKPQFTFRPESDTLWKDILHSMGRKYQIISNYPTDPRDN
jgi:putative transcriptional regulator